MLLFCQGQRFGLGNVLTLLNLRLKSGRPSGVSRSGALKRCCRTLNNNASRGLRHLLGLVWTGLGGVALLEEVSLKVGFGSVKTLTFSRLSTLLQVCGSGCESSASAPATKPVRLLFLLGHPGF